MSADHRSIWLSQKATHGNVPEHLGATLLVALEIRRRRVRIDQQRLGNLLDGPAVAEQDHSIDPIGFAFVACLPVIATEFT
jgi:hypothetical protein